VSWYVLYVCAYLQWGPSLSPSLLLVHSTKTSKTAVFAGSMQLLAGIKLCTGRVLTNHPHYEDKDLRERTKQVVESALYCQAHTHTRRGRGSTMAQAQSIEHVDFEVNPVSATQVGRFDLNATW